MVIGGPGSGKAAQSKRLVGRFPKFVHISVGQILRDGAEDKADTDEKWAVVKSAIEQGGLVSQVCTAYA